ncbi:MAG: 6-carboxytetrahydropterin synthase [Chloroflexi bacterium]|nr:6-carboxytetrahydropterin synthase [Chloroflexota bacterium]
MTEANGTYRVSIEVEFAYGHRLLNYDGKCAHPHGHNARVEIELEGQTLDSADLLVDFTVLKHALRDWVDEHVDHKMILRSDDPLVAVLRGLNEPVFVIDVNPTAESLAALIYGVASEQGFPVSRVKFWESPTSRAEYAPAHQTAQIGEPDLVAASKSR